MNDTTQANAIATATPSAHPIAQAGGIPSLLDPAVFTSPQVDKIAAALAKAQGAVKAVIKNETAEVRKKDADRVSYTYEYAGLDAVMEAVREAASANGLAVIQRFIGAKAALHTVLVHESGQWIDYGVYSLGTANTHQEKGGSITYARRYTVLCIFGVAPQGEDDDAAKANETLGREEKRPPASAPKRAQRAPVDEDLGAPIELPTDNGPARAPGQQPTDKERREAYTAAKQEWKVKQVITPDGYINFDDFAANIEHMLDNEVKTMNDLSMLGKANNKMMEEMEMQRPDLHKSLSDKWAKLGQKLL